MSTDINRIKEILELLEKTPFSEIEWEEADFKIRVKKKLEDVIHPVVAPVLSHVQPETPKIHSEHHDKRETEIELTENRALIRSPLVGTFYRSSSPNTPPFVNVGDIIKPRQVLCIIEAMKLMNEVECDCAGKVIAILVNNAQPVEYGEPLFVIETEKNE